MLVRPAHTRPAHADGALAVALEVALSANETVQCGPNESCVLWHDGVALGLLASGSHNLDRSLMPFVEPALAGTMSKLIFVSTRGSTVKLGNKLSGIPDAETGRSLDAQMLAEVEVEVVEPLKMAKAAGGQAEEVLPFVERQLQQTLERAVFELAASGIPAANVQNCQDAMLDKMHGVAQLEAWGIRAVAIELLKLIFDQQASPESAPGATAIADSLEVLESPPDPVTHPVANGGQAAWAAGAVQPGPVAAASVGAMAMGAQPMPSRSQSRAPRRGGMLVLMILGLLLVAAVVVGGHLYNEMQSDEQPATRKPNPKKAKRVRWQGRSTYRCSKGNKKISNVSASLGQGVAIMATGRCRLSLINVNIEAPVVIQARNDAQVYVIGGSITGTTHSIDVAGDAKVTMKKAARLRGPLSKTGNGRVLRAK